MSPVRTECGMLVMCRMQCSMSESVVAWSVVVLSRGGMYMLATVMCLVLFMCMVVSCSSVVFVLMVGGKSVVVKGMLSCMNVMSPPPVLCVLSVRRVVKLGIFGVLALEVSLVS